MQNNMAELKIAITGGIGSGKSTVAEIIKNLGYKVFSCDKIAHALYKTDAVKEILVKEFGEGILNSFGRVCRKKLSKTVFKSKPQLKRLNELTHPLIIQDLYDKMNKAKGIVFAEVPLLFECNMQGEFDKVFIVTRPIEDRIDSVIKRSKLSKDEVLARIKNQFNYENLPKIEHTIISNDSDLDSLTDKIRCAIDSI